MKKFLCFPRPKKTSMLLSLRRYLQYTQQQHDHIIRA